MAALQQENAALRGGGGADGGGGSPGGRTASPVGITRARVAAGLGGSPPLIAVQNGGATVAAQLGMVARRLRAEEARGDREEAEAVSEQLSALATLLESAAQELHQKSEDVATEREAHDVTAHRLAMLQKKYAVMELRDSVAEDVRGERTSSPRFDRQPIAHRSPGPGGGGGSPKHDAPARRDAAGTSGGAGGRRRPRTAAARAPRRPAPESEPADDWDDRSDELGEAGAEPTRQQRWAAARGPSRDHSAPPVHHRSAPPAAVRRAPSPQSTARRRSSVAQRSRPRGRPASNPRAYAPSSLRCQQRWIEWVLSRRMGAGVRPGARRGRARAPAPATRRSRHPSSSPPPPPPPPLLLPLITNAGLTRTSGQAVRCHFTGKRISCTSSAAGK